MTDDITLPRAVSDRDAMKLALRALDTLSAYTLVSHEGSIYAQARKTLRAALAEPPATREPATDEQVAEAYKASYDNGWFWRIFCDAWREAERFHGIGKEDKT